jgi:hypothetical protein
VDAEVHLEEASAATGDQWIAKHATALQDALEKVRSGCAAPTAPSTSPGFCLSAAKRFCGNGGHQSGFGPVTNGSGQATTVICLDL